MNKAKLLLLIPLFCSLYVRAQTPQKSTTAQEKSMKLFFEKSYLHTDRSYYSSGETVWFATYLVNGKSTSLTETSNNLYVELISPSSKIIDTKLLRVDGGLGKGDLKLKDSLATGWYQIRAYTNWMRNFGDDFVFKKKIYIRNTIGLKPKTEAIAAKNKVLTFFPEGGSLVEGLNSVVAFKANDDQGNGTAVKGSIISAKGDTITSFQSTDAGLGLFTFSPQAGEQYSVAGSFGSEPFKMKLPAILSKGLAIHATVDSLSIKTMISANTASFEELRNKQLTLSVKHAGDIIYSGIINLTQPNATANIPTKDLPAGVAVLTVSDHLGRPNCERLIYIQPTGQIRLTVTPQQSSYKTREKVSLNIKATNAAGSPVKASLSLAAVDALIPDDGIDIVTYLMLQSEVRGEIKNPSSYFDPQNPSRFKQLNLLLLTQGWRDYIWKKVADSTLKITYLPEPGITITGKVREKIAEKPMPGMNITLFGSNFIGNKIFSTTTDKNGKYYLDGLRWYGNQQVKLSAQDQKGKKGGWLQIDTSRNSLPINAIKTDPRQLPSNVFDEMQKRMAYNRTYKTGDEINLDEVKVSGEQSGQVDLFQQTLSTFGYKDQVFNITAADYSFKGLEHWLLTKVKGAVSIDAPESGETNQDTTTRVQDFVSTKSATEEGIAFMSNGKKIRPRILVNNREDLQDRLDYYSLTMDQVDKVVVKHLVDSVARDVYVLSLTLKENALRGPNLHLVNVNLNGYYEARTFYSPNYEATSPQTKDLRTTLFWTPLIKTNDAGEANVTYYNGDTPANILVKTEGITNQGTAVSAKATYKVQ